MTGSGGAAGQLSQLLTGLLGGEPPVRLRAWDGSGMPPTPRPWYTGDAP